ncbi:MAG: DUF1232 domain-containing protein [Polyangiaceae bacterium]|nr:DUF1232 domain-containing protein [Polyangiaceae bacterium]MBK8937458.1 DUF1232 domain-containing protein [Polyangiaceae bacterium]
MKPPVVKRRRGFSVVPFFGDLVVFSRVLRDGRAHWGMKLVAVATLLYVIFPVDLVPEAFLPIIAWLDDIGLVLAVRLALNKALEIYRYPLFEPAPVRKEDRPSWPDPQLASG